MSHHLITIWTIILDFNNQHSQDRTDMIAILDLSTVILEHQAQHRYQKLVPKIKMTRRVFLHFSTFEKAILALKGQNEVRRKNRETDTPKINYSKLTE